MACILIVNQGWERSSEEALSMQSRFEEVVNASFSFVANPKTALQLMLYAQFDAVLMGGRFESFPAPDVAGAMMVAYVRKHRPIPICMISSDENMNKDGLACGANAVWSKRQMRGGEYAPLIDFLRLARIPVKA